MLRERETTIEGQDEIMLASMATTKNIEELEKIKKEHGLKIYLKLTPLFDYISNNKLSVEENNQLIESIMNNIYIYFYINNDLFILILNYIGSNINKLDELEELVVHDKIPKRLMVDNPAHEHLSPNLKKIYHLRYQSMLLRYITLLKNTFI